MCKLKEGDRVFTITNGEVRNGTVKNILAVSRLKEGEWVDVSVAVVNFDGVLEKVYASDLTKADTPTEQQETQAELETQEALVTYRGLKKILTDVGAEICKETLKVNQPLATQLIIVSAVYAKLVMEKVFKDSDKDD